MNGVRKSIHDIYGCTLMMDLAIFKEEFEDERRSQIASTAEPIRHYISE